MKGQSKAIEVRQVAPNDIAAVGTCVRLFNSAPTAEAARRFLADGKNVLLFAYLDGEPVGFARAVLLDRLDTTRRQLFLHEIGVAADYRRRGPDAP